MAWIWLCGFRSFNEHLELVQHSGSTSPRQLAGAFGYLPVAWFTHFLTFSPRAVPFARHTLVFTVIGWFFEAFSWWSSTAGVRVHGRGFRLPSSGVVHPLCRSRDKLCSPWGLYIFARLGPAWLRGWVGCLIGPEPYPTPPPQGSGFDHQKSPPPHLISTYPFIRLVVERRGSIWAGVFLGRFPPPPPKSDFLYGKTLPPHL